MKRPPFIAISSLLVIAFGLILYGKLMPIPAAQRNTPQGKKEYIRIISLSPSITETLFALGLGDKIVGVTRFCQYPPEARLKQEVGGYVDPNYEAIVSLNPDLVILLEEQGDIRKYLDDLGKKYLTVSNRTVPEILETILTIGKTCGAKEQAQVLVNDIKSRIQAVQTKMTGLPKPRVLISIERSIGSGSLEEVYIAGKNTFYDEMIRYAGGINAYDRREIAYPVLSAEGVLVLNPDIIIDLIPNFISTGFNEKTLLKEWYSIPGLTAVKNNRVYMIANDYSVIPGPRFIQLVEDLARLFHPELLWEPL